MAEQMGGAGYALVDKPAQPKPIEVPPSTKRRIDRSRAEMKRDANKRRLCVRMERGDSFDYLDHQGALQSKALQGDPVRRTGKPPHRKRNRFNFIRPIVEDKVSAATQRIPGYEVDPSTTDPEDAAGANLSQRVAVYGYDAWNLRKATVDTVKTAIGLGGAGYAMPYFESNVGPYTEVEGHFIGQGDLRVKVFGGNEVGWEPGCDFETSPYWVTWQALPIDQIKEIPGYVGGGLNADAAASDVPNDHSDNQNLATLCCYYERPCPKWPNGRWFTICNHRVIVDNQLLDPTAKYVWQDYPLQDPSGTVLDEPLLHRLVYTHDPTDDNDLGLTWQLIDFQKSLQDCINKMLEYKNMGLNLQMLAPVNSLIDRPDDVPGTVKYYKVGPNGEKPEWARAPDGSILNALLQIFNLLVQQMKDVASYEDVHADPNVAARTTAAVIEQSMARWQSFLGDLAEWHSRLMRHCLLLVARYYTEPRLLEIRGRMGWEPIRDFRGSHLNGQANVRVFPGSLEYLTKQQVTARVQYYASMGWISGQQAMQAIESGQIEKVTEDYNLAVAKINRIIQKIRDGSIMDMPTRTEMVPGLPDPLTGQAQDIPTEVPGWMPSEFDNVPIWIENLGRWLQTEDYENSAREAQEVGKLMWQGLQDLKKRKAAEDAAQQQAMASSLGMGNAASPQGPPSLPSLPNVAAGGAPEPAKAPQDQQG